MTPGRPRWRVTDFVLACIGTLLFAAPLLGLGVLFGASDGSWYWDAAGVLCVVAFFVLIGSLHEHRPDQPREAPSRIWFFD